MNSEKVIFGFFITLAAALNFGFWTGEMDRVELHKRNVEALRQSAADTRRRYP